MERKSPRHSPVTPVEAVLWEPGGSPWACEGYSVSPANSSALLPLELPPSSQLFQQVPWRSSGAPAPWARPMLLLSCTESSVDWSSAPEQPCLPLVFFGDSEFSVWCLVSVTGPWPSFEISGEWPWMCPLGELLSLISWCLYTSIPMCYCAKSPQNTVRAEAQGRATVSLCKPWATWRGMSQASGSGGFSSLLYSSNCPNSQQR